VSATPQSVHAVVLQRRCVSATPQSVHAVVLQRRCVSATPQSVHAVVLQRQPTNIELNKAVAAAVPAAVRVESAIGITNNVNSNDSCLVVPVVRVEMVLVNHEFYVPVK
jgi:hypothetical protein